MVDVLGTNDVQLTASDVGQLQNANQVVNFFGRLRYQVDGATVLTHAALGMGGDEWRYSVHKIWQAATDPDEEIRVYLMEVRSVTVQLKQKLAQRFRDRSGEILLVLTGDGYESFDFVLLERALAKSKALGQAEKQVIRPRSLTVDRRNPSVVALRVLRRFTYTESDYLFQWEKLRSAFTLAEWSEPTFNNRALFSDYYLKHRLADAAITPAWAEDVRPVGREAHRLLSDARSRFSGRPESEIRAALYEPLVARLGFRLAHNKDGRSSAEQPDYFLHDPAAAPDDPPLAALLTYVWNRNLDDVDPTRDAGTPDEIPGAVVVSVLEQGDAPWAIVTNGKLWRLYAAAAANKATNYYEVDLEEALNAEEQITALKYWWLLFRREAFGAGGFLDTLLQASQDYARELGERLKERIFEQIFPHFAAGFIAQARAQDPAALDGDAFLTETFSGTLTFLYRLMFILYAESLELLPVYEARGYQEHSLLRLKKEIAAVAGPIRELAPQNLAEHYSAAATDLYQRLVALFTAIDAGRDEWNLPVYNGGLFSPESAAGQFLARQAIPDRYLALGLDLLARDVDARSQALALIDYKDLGVRHLGSIYEGLLEFRLRIATEPLVVVKEKGRERVLPAGEAGNKRTYGEIPPGDVYLENDKRERKATGSYYTPDYIVKYIVEHTVGPVLERKFAALAPRLRDAQRQYRQHEQRVRARGDDQDPALFWNEPEMVRLADACLDVRTLDPAMGSGHFLVEVVDFASNRLLTFLNGWSENPVWGMLEQMRQDILADVESQGVSIDAGRLTRVALLKRAVLKRCIYGVDLNPMAVELAKVSLWLDAFTLGAPLSFLDHHLKQGNSLIGARVREVEEAVAGAQRDLFTPQHFVQLGQAVQGMRRVSFLPDNTPGQVAESRQQYQLALDNVEPLKRVLDVYTSRWFGNEPGKAFDPALYFLQQPEATDWRRDPSTPLPARGGADLQAIAATTLQARDVHHFFHWELEFPEVFFAPSTPGGQDVELQEDGGFDAVIGNPPYGAARGTGHSFLKSMYISADLDLYTVFVEQGLALVAEKGHVSLIIPNTWMQIFTATHFRKFLIASHTIKHVVHSKEHVFADATVDTEILVVEKTEPRNNRIEIEIWSPGKVQHYSVDQQHWIAKDGDIVSVLLDETAAIVTAKMEDSSFGLAELFPVKNGIKPFEIGKGTPPQSKKIAREQPYVSDHKVDDTFKPLLRGSLIDRYANFWNGDYWVSYGPWLAAPRDPQIFFGIREKIVIRQTGFGLIATKVDNSFVARNNLHLILPNEGELSIDYLLALLNSNLLNYYYHLLNPEAGETFAEVKLAHVERLPIVRIDFSTRLTERERRVSELSEYLRPSGDGLIELIQAELANGATDVVHDILALLAHIMLEVNQEKVAEERQFFDWLEDRLRIQPSREKKGVATLSGYTIIHNYLGDYQKGEPELPWAEMEYRLYQNRSRFAANWASVKGEVQAAYEQSLATLRPIKQRLAETDALIDRIVYRLYGLTDEEVRLVEQPAYEQALTAARAQVAADKKLQGDPDAAAAAVAATVLPAAQRLLQRVEHAAERAALDADLPGWQLYPDPVPTFLLTGEYSIQQLPDHLDFAASVMSYAKAVETMLFHRLFLPFRDEAGAPPDTAHNSFLRQFLAGERDKLTLGSMQIILASSKESALRAFAAARFYDAPTRLFGPAGVAALLNDPTALALRNAAAHDQLMTRAGAQSARAWAVSILEKL